MTLTQLEIFSLVAELQGFTSAATRLGITQSAVSHAIKSLEQELQVDLFRRHQAQVELTDIGTQLLLRARAMLGLAATLAQEAADARGMKRGTLRIGSFGPPRRSASCPGFFTTTAANIRTSKCISTKAPIARSCNGWKNDGWTWASWCCPRSASTPCLWSRTSCWH